MQVDRIEIHNFLGIKEATLDLVQHAVDLLGDSYTGKTMVLDALDLALGPDRLKRTPPVDEHDFFLGRYLPESPMEAAEGDAGQEVVDHPGDQVLRHSARRACGSRQPHYRWPTERPTTSPHGRTLNNVREPIDVITVPQPPKR
jgi:hypothetical protein